MNIQQLSANIEQKLKQLDQQINAISLQLTTADSNKDQLLRDIAALQEIKTKLQRSRDIAWRAHDLQTDAGISADNRRRLLGIALCVISGLGLLAIAAVVILR